MGERLRVALCAAVEADASVLHGCLEGGAVRARPASELASSLFAGLGEDG